MVVIVLVIAPTGAGVVETVLVMAVLTAATFDRRSPTCSLVCWPAWISFLGFLFTAFLRILCAVEAKFELDEFVLVFIGGDAERVVGIGEAVDDPVAGGGLLTDI